MPGDIAAARQLLVDVLEPVWPGRVYPYRPTRPSPVAGVYVCQFDLVDDGTTWGVQFAVRCVADGADRAADALLDEMVDACFDAVRATPADVGACYPRGAQWDPLSIDDVTELPAYTLTVEVTVADATPWCVDPPPAAVTVPPVPIGV